MLIKCNECGHDNQLGAIFCRECGEKLEVETMRPEVEPQSKKNTVELIKNIVAIVVLLTLVIVIALMFWPESGNSYQLTQEDIPKAEQKFGKLMRYINGRNKITKKFVFTREEATYLYNNKITGIAGEAGEGEEGEEESEASAPVGYAIKKMHIKLESNGYFKFIADSTFLGIPVTFSLRGYHYFDEDTNQLQFKVRSAKMGHLSVPFGRNKIISKFTPPLQDGIPAEIISATTKLETESGDIHIWVKPHSKK